jgi:DNA-binding XRE family transcriptional regulator
MKEISPSTRLVIANKCGIAEQYLYQIFSGRKKPSAELCVSIERATDGEVTRRDLRPTDWQNIWPELLSTPNELPKPVIIPIARDTSVLDLETSDQERREADVRRDSVRRTGERREVDVRRVGV